MKNRLWVLLAIGVFAFAGLASAQVTVYVPDDHDTITEALAAAAQSRSNGDPADDITRIVVTEDYDGTGEVFPILVQVDDLTIEADGDVTVEGVNSKAVFVVGGKRVYNPTTHQYDVVRVQKVTIKGFKITGGDIGILVKEADEVTLSNNHIYYTAGEGPMEGIRLLNAAKCLLVENEIVRLSGIGIFIQGSSSEPDKSCCNVLQGNSVSSCGLGLLIFESNNNTDTNGSYTENTNGGVVINDSSKNTLSKLYVWRNAGWGVRFVYADENALKDSEVIENTWGGVELLASQNNIIEGNLVYSNGTANDGSDDAQIVITKGDKAIFTTDVFTDYNKLGDLSEFVKEKHKIYDKLDLLVFWLDDLNFEMRAIRQKIATAIGMCEEEDGAGDIQALIDEIIAEKRAIEEGKIYNTLDNPYKDTAGNEPVVFTEGSKMTDPAYNFTLADTTNELAADLDAYTDDGTSPYKGPNFGLNRDGADPDITDDNEISWSKLDLIDILILAIRYEIWNDFDADSLKEKIDYLEGKGLITEGDADALREKLDAALGFLAQIERIKVYDTDDDGTVYPDDTDDAIDSLVEKLAKIDDLLEEAKAELGEDPPDYATAREKLLDAKAWVEEFMAEKDEIYDLIEDIRYKLCLVDIELPPFPEVNTNFVGKKEKPFDAITDDEINAVKDDIVAALNDADTAIDTTQEEILNAVVGREDFERADIDGAPVGVACSTGNTIASNLISSDLLNTDRNIGLVIECSGNFILNNLFTNERVQPIDDKPAYGEYHRLDIAIILLSDENLIAYNAIEWVNNGIIRGGKWRRKDKQVEYVFAKLAEAAYWPPPGYTVTDSCGSFDEDHFDRRPVAWVTVVSVSSKTIPEVDDEWLGFEHSQRVKRNRLSLNFFDHCGTGIEIWDAESNRIDENLFYLVASGNIIFRAGGPHPWDTGEAGNPYKDQTIGGAGPGIVLEHNDHYGGVAVMNESPFPVNDSADYTAPDGPGHATVFGPVTPPGAPSPYACANFGTEDKFKELEDNYEGLNITQYFPGEDAPELLPPNLDFFGFGSVGLPDDVDGDGGFTPGKDKPRHPSDIFGTCAIPGPNTYNYAGGWNLASVPLDPDDPDPDAVYGDDLAPLYIWQWDPGQGRYVVPEAIAPAEGYWLHVPAGGATVDVTGDEVTVDVALALAAAGWYQISAPWAYPRDAIVFEDPGGDLKTWDQAVAVGWIADVLWGYTPGVGYQLVNVLDPWQGYWLLTLVDGLVMHLAYADRVGAGMAIPETAPLAVPEGAPAPPPPPVPPEAGSGELVVGNFPNPVRDVNTTVFRVLGPMAAQVEEIRVRIFDLSGQLMWQGTAAGAELEWHTDDLAGQYLANGVYLYQVQVKVGGNWITTELKVLAILR